MTPARALFLRTIADARIRITAFGLLFFAMPCIQAIAYRDSYPTLAERAQFAQAFARNKALRLFYGVPYDLTDVGGYVSWRIGGILTLFAAFYGALAAIRAFRSDEEAGRYELIAAGAISRSRAFFARAAALLIIVAPLFVGTALGMLAGGLAAVDSMYLALALIGPAAVYAAMGVVACQWLPTTRGALQLAVAVLALDFAIRIVADTTDATWLHWFTPLGWVEEVRPFAGSRPIVLLLFAAATVIVLVPGLILESRRDIGSALLAPSDTVRNPSLRFLRWPVLLALQAQVTSLFIWAAGIAGFGFVVGTISKSVVSGLSENLIEQLEKLGVNATPSGYIGLTFLFFIFAIALFCCSQLAAIREDEAEGRLETLFALPVARARWFAERTALAATIAAVIALLTGLATALGATVVGADVSFVRLLGAGANALPASLLFLGIGALLVAAFPRSGVGLAYGVVIVAFVWEVVGSLLSVPEWVLGVSPFHQVALVPAVPFEPAPPAIMLAIAFVATAAAIVRFRTRDLIGA